MNFSIAMELQRAWRRLVRAPGFSLSVIVLIALSIGGVAAVATAGWSLFLKPLPYSQADQLVTVSASPRRTDYHLGLSAALVEELNQEQQFGTLAIVVRSFDLRMAGGTAVRAGRIDHRVLDVLRVFPLAGRVLTEHDAAPGADSVALISERLWRDRFGGDDGVIGTFMELEDGRARIVGVLPDRFVFPEANTDVWLPMELGPQMLLPARYGNLHSSRTVVARMPDGYEFETFSEKMRARLENEEWFGSRDKSDFRVRPLREIWSGGQADGLLIVAIGTAVVLLATWLNLAGLWLARWTGRTHELAIQLALGARSRVAIAGIVFEYLLLGVPGLVLAMGVSGIGIEMLYSLGVLDESGPLRAKITVPTVLAGMVLLAVGLLPVLTSISWTMRRLGGNAAVHLGGKGTGAQGHGAGMRKLLMIGQIGIAFSLLLALGLLVSSWLRLLDEDPGFDSGRLVVAMVRAPAAAGPDSGADVGAVADRLGALAPVDGVAWSNSVPFGGLEFVTGVAVNDRSGDPVPARVHSVGPGFFQVAGIDVISGRAFGPEDSGEGVRNVIVDKTFERRYLDGSALGRRVGYSVADHVVVGVVDSVRHNRPDETLDEPAIYSYSGAPESQTQFLLRTSMDPDSLVGVVRDTLRQELGSDRVAFVATVESMIRRVVRDREPQLILIATFSGLALLLVFYGLFALQSYRVAARVAEIGLRRALGASSTRILGAELVRATSLMLPGLLLGVLGGWLGMQLIADKLYKVGLADPGLWLATGAAIALTIVLASLVPALRASRIAPMEALRYE